MPKKERKRKVEIKTYTGKRETTRKRDIGRNKGGHGSQPEVQLREPYADSLRWGCGCLLSTPYPTASVSSSP